MRKFLLSAALAVTLLGSMSLTSVQARPFFWRYWYVPGYTSYYYAPPTYSTPDGYYSPGFYYTPGYYIGPRPWRWWRW
jgi:hypothetical protein